MRSVAEGKTVLLFPGLDAIFSSVKMKQWLPNAEVAKTLTEASQHLSRLTGQHEDLATFIASHKYLHLADFDRTLVALTALQVGIARQISLPWDIAQGCSHGDVARSVMTESFSFKDAIELLWIFSELRKASPKGFTANVRTRSGEPLSTESLQWLREAGAPVSTWSHTNATIGGSEEILGLIVAEATDRGLKIKPILQYPIHSPAMLPSMMSLRDRIARFKIANPRKRVFSSVWIRYLATADDIREEALAGAVSEIRWMETLTHLFEQEGATTFINVGPSNTLTGWMFDHPQFQSLRLIDGWDAVKNSLPSRP